MEATTARSGERRRGGRKHWRELNCSSVGRAGGRVGRRAVRLSTLGDMCNGVGSFYNARALHNGLPRSLFQKNRDGLAPVGLVYEGEARPLAEREPRLEVIIFLIACLDKD